MHRDDSYAATSAGSAASDDERDLIVCGTTSSARAARDMFVAVKSEEGCGQKSVQVEIVATFRCW